VTRDELLRAALKGLRTASRDEPDLPTLATLEHEGLVRKTRSPSIGRRVPHGYVWTLTQKGRRALEGA